MEHVPPELGIGFLALDEAGPAAAVDGLHEAHETHGAFARRPAASTLQAGLQLRNPDDAKVYKSMK